jgi:predicted AlkP superfamily pyrophosphatase or phosphodiesterase
MSGRAHPSALAWSCRLIATVGVTLAAALAAGCGAAVSRGERPRLAVVLAVDQLRADLLERCDPALVGGLRRLLDRGRRFTRAMVDHAITGSHAGHATLATGCVPARHGIVDAAFYETRNGVPELTDALRDPLERMVDVAGIPGVSPRRILAGTLTGWFVRADPETRFAAVGSGAFLPILHAGGARGDVYWFLPAAGRFVTSSYYRPRDPDWVRRFNARILPRFVEASLDWYSEVPAGARALALPDAAPGEAGGGHASFPHLFDREVPQERRGDPMFRSRWFAGTPLPDAATLALAREAIVAGELGRRGTTDVLTVVLSQIDAVGHRYGPRSQEVLDALLRLDRELGAFFNFLDATVGEGRWVVALSSDHGVADLPETAAAEGRPGRRVRMREVEALMRRLRQEGAPDRPGAGSAERIARILEEADFVADAMTPAELRSRAAPEDLYARLYRNSVHPDRVPRFPFFDMYTGESPVARAGVVVRLVEGAVLEPLAAEHGSPYDYDRHVPLLFMGPGVPPGASDVEARTVDLAPTLAALCRVEPPAPIDGRALLAPP